MDSATYTPISYLLRHSQANAPSSREADDSFLEDLVHQKSRIQKTKLEVLTSEILVRLNIMSRNITRLHDQKEAVQEMLNRVDHLSNYHLREHREKGEFYRQLFTIEVERRQQEVECWRDVAMVMRDFLEIWEAHQQAQARATFINDAGS